MDTRNLFEEFTRIREISDYWINKQKESDREHMYLDALTSIREAILLLVQIHNEKSRI